jgi:hypothetical protein
MPKQTTPFQTFMKNVYSQLEGENGFVVESQMLKEKSTDSEREIDIFIKRNVLGKEVTVAIECREWRNKNSIKWVDELIGKYIDLSVDEIIAVSKSGFYKPAKEKAEFHGIKTLTLEEANEIEWKKYFTKLFLKTVKRTDFPQGIELKTEFPVTTSLSLQSQIFFSGQSKTLEQFGKYGYDLCINKINSEIEKKIILGDPNPFEREVSVEIAFAPSQDVYVVAKNQKNKILEVIIRIKSSFDVQPIQSNQYFFDDKGITEAKIANEKGEKFQIIATQELKQKPVINLYPMKDDVKKSGIKRK